MDTPDFIPDEQVSAQPIPQSMPQQAMPEQVSNTSSDFIPDDQFVADEDKYGTPGQQLLAGAEAAGRGMLGPIAPAIEKHVLGVSSKDILGREEANPVTSGLGEVAGLGAGLLTGTGEAKLMTKAGELAAEATGLSAAKEAPLIHRIGSSAVQQAAEMAVLQAGDEKSKLLLNDPETSAETAIANVGMAAALGGAGGAFLTGAVSPLWKATAGPKVEALLNGVKDHLNGTGILVPEEIQKGINTLGIDVAPEIKAGISGAPGAVNRFNVLKETQNKTILDGIEKLNKDASESVMQSIGVSPTDLEVYSEADAGHELLDAFKKEYNTKYEPIAKAFAKRDAEAAGIAVTDDARLRSYGKLLEDGMTKVGTDSPYYKLYEDYGNRMLAKDSVGALDQLKTEINNSAKTAKRAGDFNTMNALNDIKSSITNLQESQIEKTALTSEALGVKGATKAGEDLLAERALTNKNYADFARMSDELTNHLGVGDFRGAGTLESKLTSKIAAEDLLKKFSIRGNADFIPFLEQNFPETLNKVKEAELKRLLKPAILGAKSNEPINIKKLSDIVSKGMAGQKEYIESILPKGALEKIEAARTVIDSIPNPKSSGTAGWMTKVMSKMPQSAMAAVAMIAGHNPLFGYLAGEMAQRLGRNIPDAINLGYLKFLGSGQPVKSEAFKAMVEMFHNTYKGVDLISKATANVLKSGNQVLTTHQIPSHLDLQKLDKLVAKYQDSPNKVYALQNSDIGHYLPDHQASLTEVSTRALQYLQSIKPKEFKASPLDKPIPPSKAEISRYNRALEIAQQPAIVLQHIKQGTLQVTDMKDLGAMYPGLYRAMADKLTIHLSNAQSEEEPIPYKTRMGLSLFLGQPLDSTMTPSAIQAAQMTYLPKTPQNAPGSTQTKKGTSTLGKSNKDYKTPLQASETHHSERK